MSKPIRYSKMFCQAPNQAVFYQAIGYLAFKGCHWANDTGPECFAYTHTDFSEEGQEDFDMHCAYLLNLGVLVLNRIKE